MRCFILSQCKEYKVGEMWSNFLLDVIARAMLFWMTWSLCDEPVSWDKVSCNNRVWIGQVRLQWCWQCGSWVSVWYVGDHGDGRNRNGRVLKFVDQNWGYCQWGIQDCEHVRQVEVQFLSLWWSMECWLFQFVEVNQLGEIQFLLDLVTTGWQTSRMKLVWKLIADGWLTQQIEMMRMK